ncbi:TPA: DUF3141 domain-containing protein [Legionella anisa]|uniref:DUF3141 domain-containing protein n=1 Tax=Legionella anisa TaxID=28082 RepID=UPI001F123ABC|nr:DUF3141 domain-containing protein [Legionella anisa]
MKILILPIPYGRKITSLFFEIDTERERFLEFERWWTSYFQFNRKEIISTVENLFIGDQLEKGLFRVCKGCHADLKRIRNPMLIFASSGDNITPPHQALYWIYTAYKTTKALKEAKQRIVYLLNPHVGHLGIFVSANVVRFEHRAILESIEDLERLKPGLYEMKISNASNDPNCHKPQYTVSFEERRVEDLHQKYHDAPKAFENVEKVSELNQVFYETWIRPWLLEVYTPLNGQQSFLKWLHPMRVKNYLFSERISIPMAMLPLLASWVQANRQPVDANNGFKELEHAYSNSIAATLDSYKQIRDHQLSLLFNYIYGE